MDRTQEGSTVSELVSHRQANICLGILGYNNQSCTILAYFPV